MPSRKSASRIPSYRRHKPSGQAVLTLNGRDIYLGRWGIKASRAEYERLIGEWLVSGRSIGKVAQGSTVAELALAYWRHAIAYYRKDGWPTVTLDGGHPCRAGTDRERPGSGETFDSEGGFLCTACHHGRGGAGGRAPELDRGLDSTAGDRLDRKSARDAISRKPRSRQVVFARWAELLRRNHVGLSQVRRVEQEEVVGFAVCVLTEVVIRACLGSARPSR